LIEPQPLDSGLFFNQKTFLRRTRRRYGG